MERRALKTYPDLRVSMGKPFVPTAAFKAELIKLSQMQKLKDCALRLVLQFNIMLLTVSCLVGYLFIISPHYK